MSPTPALDRRRLFTLTAAGAAALATGAIDSRAWAAESGGPGGRLPDGLLGLGVASGDPLPDSVVLWTRLAPDPVRLDGRGGMPSRPVPVHWQVAEDEGFRRVVAAGQEVARPQSAHSVHVDVRGLRPARWYYYRFRSGQDISPNRPHPNGAGSRGRRRRARLRLRVLPELPDGLLHRLPLHARRGARPGRARRRLHLRGSGSGQPGARAPPRGRGPVLADYRVRHAQYKTDPDLQAVHAAAPWVVTWDDHEVENNWADEDADPDVPVEEFLQRRAVAFQAYYENMPLRRAQAPMGPDLLLYRRLGFGDLATFHVLDTRQYRSDQPACADADCPEAFDPSRTMLGAEQERWLLAGLGSGAGWDVLAQQVPVYEDAPVGLPADRWDGYRASRARLLGSLAERRLTDTVVITGDVHFNSAADLKADFDDPESATVGSELVGTSISSGGDGTPKTDFGPFPANPHIVFTNKGQRGYVRCDVTRDQWRADYRVVDTVRRRESAVSTLASFAIERGRPGLQRA